MFRQVREPLGFDPASFGGPWPEGGVLVTKMCLAPLYASWRTRANCHTGRFHTPTLKYAHMHTHSCTLTFTLTLTPTLTLTITPTLTCSCIHIYNPISVTQAWLIGDNPTNHLHLGRSLQRLMAALCDCKSGKPGACAHVSAATVALCCPGAFRSSKKQDAQLVRTSE